MNEQFFRRAFAVCPAALVLATMVGTANGEELRRRGMMGVQIAPVTDENRERLQLGSGSGIVVQGTMPGTPAEAAGLQANDVIVKIGEEAVADFQGSLNLLRRYRAGDTLKLTVMRAGQPVAVEFALAERPKETSTEFEVMYDAAGSPGKQVRTIVTRPKTEGRLPAILFIPSLMPASIEFAQPQQARHPYKQLVDRLTRAGFVTMRVERYGNGDSDGDDPRHPKLADDVLAFSDGLADLRAYEFVDPDRVFVFAQSLGTVIAPSLAREGKVRAVITYAAIARPWQEHQTETMTNRWKFELVPEDELKSNVENLRRFTELCLLKGESPQAIIEKHPELKETTGAMVQDEAFIMGSHFSFFQELAGMDLAGAWADVGVPVLALWGECDFVAGKACSQLVESAVNKRHPGLARFSTLPNIDHNFDTAEDAEESFLAGFGGTFNDNVIQAVADWTREVSKKATS